MNKLTGQKVTILLKGSGVRRYYLCHTRSLLVSADQSAFPGGFCLRIADDNGSFMSLHGSEVIEIFGQ